MFDKIVKSGDILIFHFCKYFPHDARLISGQVKQLREDHKEEGE